jgi:hypothetical protein
MVIDWSTDLEYFILLQKALQQEGEQMDIDLEEMRLIEVSQVQHEEYMHYEY